MRVSKKEIFKKKPLRKASAKAQSAMEYLMTYGWAILIISVVLAALFQLGVFNPMTFAPKAPPGACQVFRPNGPYTTSFINLEGVCSGELPQYVLEGGPNPNTYVAANDNTFNSTFANTDSLTVANWIYELPNSGCELSTINIYAPNWQFPTPIFRFGVSGGGWSPNRVMLELFTTSTQTNMFSSNSVPYNSWHFIAATYNGNYVNFYIDGVPAGVTSYNSIVSTGPRSEVVIGGNPYAGCSNFFPGYISNIQLYNTSLSANDIQALYLEGIGGAPIRLQNLVAWWPLNGNANDYSGNNNNGQASNVNFVSNWYNGYTPP
ncbi:MAG: LamG domain-containing protein [Candidatus Micrarchaeota archaeon]